MKFATALAFAAGVAAHAKNVTYTTEVVTAYTTYCPGPTEIVHGDKTYTITEATTLTITDCPCTVTKPVITTSAVVCHDCPAPPAHHGNNSTLVPVYPTGKPGHGGESGKPGSPAGPGRRSLRCRSRCRRRSCCFPVNQQLASLLHVVPTMLYAQ
ncbi:unnamed protein product [Fusarium fujikuroi]|nr:hypothetical protein CEK25_008459 [Fusarium fujikuroi]VTT71565.1 unnamed protein product [Fusarium fujikuroi]